MSKLRPLLFSTSMALANLDGRKGQTRRLLKPQPLQNEQGLWQWITPAKRGYAWFGMTPNLFRQNLMHSPGACPYGVPGDVLWQRETLYYDNHSGDDWCYQAGNDPVLAEYTGILERTDKKAIPSIHMPYIACRFWGNITAIRVERLMDISEDDAIAEGIEVRNIAVSDGGDCVDFEPCYRLYHAKNEWDDSAIISYSTLWESLHGPGSWEANPWVWVIEYTPTTKPDCR